MFVSELPYSTFGSGFGGGVEDPWWGFGTQLFVFGFSPGVPVRGGEGIGSFRRIRDGGKGRGYHEGFKLRTGMLVGGRKDAESAVDGRDDHFVPCFDFKVYGRGGVDDCSDP